ncbi:glutamate--tRNA ligase [Litorimonas sp. WD9-15]|uniref:glutamate--tRNA ligase n=1 Tax=Litorimonas sp. WD9-15 TaxID=3418716 RepID=UPI003D03E05C
MSHPVVTRFAPSPTGYLHIGGARTALFNYYFAKKMGGTFRLRVEDTDKARSTEDATRAILDGMAWLGVKHDGDVVYQSRNADDHVAAAETMLANGTAYRCYATDEEVDALKAEARENNRAFRSPYRDSTDEKDAPFAVRFRVPEGQTVIQDHVQGEVKWDNSTFDDLVLLRADRTPTYMLAVVVDDHNMGVTHVIRGDDHLINAGRQTQLYQALGWNVPQWAHVPLIHGPDGKKLSKRHGALGVEAYEDLGYLPSGLRNYLMKLGWSHGDVEIFLTDEALTEAFSLDGITSSPARLDFDKMDFINAQHMAEMSDNNLMTLALPFLENVNIGPLDATVSARILAAMPTLKPRAKTLPELADQAHYLMDIRPLEITGKTAKPLKRDGAIEIVEALTQGFKSRKDAPWTADALQALLTDFATERELGFGRIGQPIRAALTGGSPSPDLSVVLALLGQDETIGRLEDAISQFKS